MGGVTDMLFGSSESPSISQADTKTGQQEMLLEELTKLMRGQIGKGVESYSGDMTAKPSDLETKGWGMINQLMGDSGGRTATNQEAISKILQGTTSVPSYDVGEFDTQGIQDWYQNALVKPAMKTWEKDVAPVVQEKFIAQNAGSSGAANRAISGSAEDLMTSLNSQLADKLLSEKGAFDTRKFTAGLQGNQNEFTAGQNDLQRILNVPGMELTDTDTLLKTILAGTTAGATERGIDQNALNAEYQKWLTSQGYANPWLSYLNTVLGTNAFENVVNPGSQQQGLFQTILGPVMGAAGQAGGFGKLFS